MTRLEYVIFTLWRAYYFAVDAFLLALSRGRLLLLISAWGLGCLFTECSVPFLFTGIGMALLLIVTPLVWFICAFSACAYLGYWIHWRTLHMDRTDGPIKLLVLLVKRGEAAR